MYGCLTHTKIKAMFNEKLMLFCTLQMAAVRRSQMISLRISNFKGYFIIPALDRPLNIGSGDDRGLESFQCLRNADLKFKIWSIV
jgi:hypothetical protein